MRCQRLLIAHNALSKSVCYSIHYYLKYNAIYITNIILVEDIHNDSNKCYKFHLKLQIKNGDRSKLDRMRLTAKREVAFVMETGKVFQILITIDDR